MILKNSYKISIIIGIIISIIIILIIIIIPNIINKKVIPVINFFNKNKHKMRSYSDSLNYSKSNDVIVDMNTDNENTIKYLNDVIEAVKEKHYKMSNNCISKSSNKNKSNNSSKFVKDAPENFKSINEESEELKNIIEYFKLIK